MKNDDSACVSERDRDSRDKTDVSNSELAMVAITEDTTEGTTGVMEAPRLVELAAGEEEADGAVVAAALVAAVVEAPHLGPGLLPDSAAQGEDEQEDNRQQPSKFILLTSIILCCQCNAIRVCYNLTY